MKDDLDTYREGWKERTKDILELIDEMHSKTPWPILKELKQRIEGETAQNNKTINKNTNLQGNLTAQNDIKLARQCMDFKMLRCDNKNCLNEFCPLQKSWNK